MLGAKQPALPDQHAFCKMPAKFGHVPVAEEPLGWDPQRRFEHLYPHVRRPAQVVERVDFGSPELEPNRLYFGDNLHIMRSLPSESIDLIYIDPPFFSQKNYNVLFGDQNELRSFKDIWDGGLNGYLVWLNARLYEMKRLLKAAGCDRRATVLRRADESRRRCRNLRDLRAARRRRCARRPAPDDRLHGVALPLIARTCLVEPG